MKHANRLEINWKVIYIGPTIFRGYVFMKIRTIYKFARTKIRIKVSGLEDSYMLTSSLGDILEKFIFIIINCSNYFEEYEIKNYWFKNKKYDNELPRNFYNLIYSLLSYPHRIFADSIDFCYDFSIPQWDCKSKKIIVWKFLIPQQMLKKLTKIVIFFHILYINCMMYRCLEFVFLYYTY